MPKAGLVLIVSGFPRQSETFALNEILALEKRGLLTAIFATKGGDGKPPHPDCLPLLNRVQILPEGNAATQATAIATWLGSTPVAGVHAYFAHQPTEVAMHLAHQLGVPYGFSVHARDARKISPATLAERARGAACVVACNPDVMAEITAAQAPIHLMPHGVDSNRFYPQPLPPDKPLQLLAVGRLVEKKGFIYLLQAVARLSLPFTLRIIGDGPERNALQAFIDTHTLGGRVALCPSQTHANLPAAYASAHIVVVPSIVDRSGDRDGLPNVLLEAMASGRPVIASDVGATSSAIHSGENGLLIPPQNIDALVAALEQLAHNTTLQRQLGQQARASVMQNFALARCTNRFCDLLETSYHLQPTTPAVSIAYQAG